jgi:bacterioferritin-associated ferredoxin
VTIPAGYGYPDDDSYRLSQERPLSTARRRPAGTVPAAFSRTGEDIPPSTEVLEHNLAQVIGQSAAVHLGELLRQLLPQLPLQPDCCLCVQAARRTVREYEARVANAQAAAEPVPDPPEAPAIGRSVTWIPYGGASVPACWEHADGQA